MGEKYQKTGINKMTAELYRQVKHALYMGDSVKDVARFYGIGESTTRMVRSSSNFLEYQAANKRSHGSSNRTVKGSSARDSGAYSKKEIEVLVFGGHLQDRSDGKQWDGREKIEIILSVVTLCLWVVTLGVIIVAIYWGKL